MLFCEFNINVDTIVSSFYLTKPNSVALESLDDSIDESVIDDCETVSLWYSSAS